MREQTGDDDPARTASGQAQGEGPEALRGPPPRAGTSAGPLSATPGSAGSHPAGLQPDGTPRPVEQAWNATLRGRLLLLIAAVALPFLLFACWTVADVYRRDHLRAAADLLTTVRALSGMPAQVAAVAASRLRGMASGHEELDADTVALLLLHEREARQAALAAPTSSVAGTTAGAGVNRTVLVAATPGELAFYGADGVLQDASAPVPDTPVTRAATRRVADTGQGMITVLVEGPDGWRLGVLVPAVPAERRAAGVSPLQGSGSQDRPGDVVEDAGRDANGDAAGQTSGGTASPEAGSDRAAAVVLARWLPPEVFTRALRNWNLPENWVAAALDRDGVLLARTQRAEALVGHPALPETLRALHHGTEGVLPRMRNQDGNFSTLAFARDGDFAVVVAVGQDFFDSALLRDVLPAATIALLLLGASLLASLAMARRLQRVLALVADQARAGSPEPVNTVIREVAELSQALAATARERNRATAALRHEEARYRALVETSSEIVWGADASGRLLPDGAQAWAGLTGVAPGVLAAQGWTAALHPDDRDAAAALWRAALSGQQPFEGEWRIPHHRPGTPGGGALPNPGGNASDALSGNLSGDPSDREGYRWLSVRAVPLIVPPSTLRHSGNPPPSAAPGNAGAAGTPRPSRTGSAREWVGLSADITELVTARERRATEAAELERLVEERTAALRTSERRLAQAQKMEALGRLAGGVAHDVNNVLQAVLGGARLITARPDDPTRVARLAQLVADQAERGAAVARRLLGFARRGELRAEAVEVGTLLHDLREVLEPTLGVRITVEVAVQPGLAPVLADKAQLETVLVNLAVNARDAMPAGGRVVFSADPGDDPTLEHERPAELGRRAMVRLAVRDEGSGMTPEVLTRITEPFFTTKPQGQGTGLGLAMARGFAEQSRGALRVRSSPGEGTTVALWLPVAPRVAAAKIPGPPLPTLPSLRILLVDDEDAVRTVLLGALEDGGHHVTAAVSPAEALQRLDEGLPCDLLLTDLAMPGGTDGLALAAAARARRPGLPVLLVTGYADAHTTARAAEAAKDGPLQVLRKPAGLDALEQALAALYRAVAPTS